MAMINMQCEDCRKIASVNYSRWNDKKCIKCAHKAKMRKSLKLIK